MLILGLVYFGAPTEFVHEPLKFLNLHFVLNLFVGNYSKVLTQFGLIFKLCDPLQVFVIEFKIAIDYLLEKHLVVLHKGVQSGLCIKGYLIRMSRVGYFLPQPAYDLIKCFEMWNVFADDSLWIRVSSLFHQIEQCLLIVCNVLPSGSNGCKNLRQILNPQVEILIFLNKLLILSPVDLDFRNHLRILFQE